MTAAQFLFEINEKIRHEVKTFADRHKLTYDQAWKYAKIKFRGYELEPGDAAKLFTVREGK